MLLGQVVSDIRWGDFVFLLVLFPPPLLLLPPLLRLPPPPPRPPPPPPPLRRYNLRFERDMKGMYIRGVNDEEGLWVGLEAWQPYANLSVAVV
jgi:hypothetical protein